MAPEGQAAGIALGALITLVVLLMPLLTYTVVVWLFPDRLRDFLRAVGRGRLSTWDLDSEWLWSTRVFATLMLLAYVALALWYLVSRL
jgi:hypothetical protein